MRGEAAHLFPAPLQVLITPMLVDALERGQREVLAGGGLIERIMNELLDPTESKSAGQCGSAAAGRGVRGLPGDGHKAGVRAHICAVLSLLGTGRMLRWPWWHTQPAHRLNTRVLLPVPGSAPAAESLRTELMALCTAIIKHAADMVPHADIKNQFKPRYNALKKVSWFIGRCPTCTATPSLDCRCNQRTILP